MFRVRTVFGAEFQGLLRTIKKLTRPMTTATPATEAATTPTMGPMLPLLLGVSLALGSPSRAVVVPLRAVVRAKGGV